MTGKFKALIAGVAGATVLVGAAQAGGFSRGTADTDILYEDGNFSMRAGATIVSPQRGYATINGVAATDGNYTESYIVPNAAIKLNLTDDARCAGTYTESFGGDANYGMQAIMAGLADGTGTSSRTFSTNEFGLTCAYKIDNVGNFDGLGSGRLFIIGGVFAEDFTYAETVRLASAAQLAAGGSPLAPFGGPVPMATSGTLSFNGDYELGYRIGLGYEIPEIAARVQLLYRSQVEHSPGGQFRFFNTATGATLAGGAAVLQTRGNGTLPQSLELKVQSGVAPGTLVFGSVKWTDWSVLQTLDYTIFTPAPVPTRLEYFWKDGWTVSGGVGRQVTDWLAASATVTWDQGVSTTEDVFTDTWTFAAGIEMSNERASLQLGGAISYLTGGSVAREAIPGRGGPGDTFAYTVGSDWSYALGGRFSVDW